MGRTKERLSLCIEYKGNKSHLLKAALNIHEANYLAANRSPLLVTDIFHFGIHSGSEICHVFYFALTERHQHRVTHLSLSLSFSNRHHHPRCLPCWLEELRLWEGGQIMCLSRCQGTAVGMRPWEQPLLVWLLADGSIRLEQQGAWRRMRLNASMCTRAYAFKRGRSYPRWNRVRCCVQTNWAVQGKRVISSNAVCHNTPGIKKKKTSLT